MINLKTQRNSLLSAALVLVAIGLSAATARAAIVAVNDGKIGGTSPGATVSQSISVGAGADMLVVMFAAELGTGGPTTVSYGGVDMTKAVGADSQAAIFYLDLATAGITGTTLTVDLSAWGVRNGHASGWVSLDGNLVGDQSIGLHSAVQRAEGGGVVDNNIDLTTTVETFNVVSFNGNGTSGSITIDSSLTQIYQDTNIGSARSAAGYEEQVAAGTTNYEWTLTGGSLPGDYRRIAAASFAVVPTPAALPAGLAMLGIIAGRRRRG